GVVAIRREPTYAAACITSDVVEAISPKKEDLVDTHPVGAAVDEMSEILVTDGDRKLDLARAGSGLVLRGAPNGTLHAGTGRSVLEAMQKARGELTERELSSLTPRATLRVTSPDLTHPGDGAPERVESIAILVDKAGAFFAHRDEDGATLSLTPEAARALL